MSSYKTRYNIEAVANPTTPGVTTQVTQAFDGNVLTDRYIKRLTNALRKHGTLPRWGGMYETTRLAARYLGLVEPVGYKFCNWYRSGGVLICGPSTRSFPYDLGMFPDMVKLSDTRAAFNFAAGAKTQPWETEPAKSEQGPWYTSLAGWGKGDLNPFREAFREHVLAHIPNYLDHMNQIADFLETRPQFTVSTGILRTTRVHPRLATLTAGEDNDDQLSAPSN